MSGPKRIRLSPCKTCGCEGHPGRTCDVAQEDRSAVVWTKARVEQLAKAPLMLVVSRRPHVLTDEPDRERRVEVLECRHELVVFASEPLEPVRKCDRCPPAGPPIDPTPAARELLPEARAALAGNAPAERPRAGSEAP